MCGIVGYNNEDPVLIGKLCDLLHHRGPDDSGYYSDESFSFGQTRLSIIDITDAGHQPMFYSSETGACSEKHRTEHRSDFSNQTAGIVFNGEIYNYHELKEELGKAGYNFSTHSDTEVVLAAYLEWGSTCVEHFNGMWAFCIYDIRNGMLFLSRDRLGIKPLYYYSDDGKFMFGSEMKVFFQANLDLSINPVSLNHYMYFGYSPRSRSVLSKVQKLLPGHNLVYDLRNKAIRSNNSYWNIRFHPEQITFEDAQEKIYSLLDDSVQKRMLADVPVGAFLSGGLDSSVIVYFMRKYNPELKTFSINFDHDDFNESKWAKIVAGKFGTDHYEISFSSSDVRKLIDELPLYFDDPFGDASMIPTYLVSKVAADHVKVCLSGTGSDELFAGYPRYREIQMLHSLRKMPGFAKKAAALAYKILDPDKAGKLDMLLSLKNKKQLYLMLLSHMFRNRKESGEVPCLKELEHYFQQESNLSAVQYFDQISYLPDDLLVKEDRATMANHLEGRVPFIDYRLVDFANSLDRKYLLYKGTGKYILKKTFEGKIPDEIINRRKQGFGVPLVHYFRNELKTFAEEILFEHSGNDYFKKEELQILWKKHQQGKSDYSPLFWNIIMYKKWDELWMKK
jgi:asparagine synthase (glutamine-hydrolysing)